MLKLTRHLFAWEPQAKYADFYERALYNDILASQNPDTGMMCYFLPLASGPKEFSTPEDFWCCVGTGVENHSKYGDSIYFHDGNTAIFVNLFIASELRWPEIGVTLQQETKYPDEGRTRLSFNCEKPVRLHLRIRHPYWSTAGFEIEVNGVRQADRSKPGSYAVVENTWKSGDTIEITMPFGLRTEGFGDNSHRVALLYGPLVLCAQTEGHTEPPYPAMIADQNGLPAGLEPVPGRSCTFVASARVLPMGSGNSKDVILEPIYRVHDTRDYVVYWDQYTPDQWPVIESQYAAVKARTVDRVLPGDEHNERTHDLRGQNTGTDGKSWRHAVDGGWFSWDLKVLSDQPQELRVKYWGSDTGGREFDVIVDGQRLATVNLDNNRPGEFYEETYPIPEQITRGKEKITIRFQAHPKKTAGGIFACTVVISGKDK